jgi:DnaJ homolog subfamily C member 9
MQVTDERLDTYYNSFRGSDAERKELLQLFERMSGDMKKVMEWLPCSEPALDSHRFMDAINAAIEAGDAKQSPTYKQWCKKVEQTPRPKVALKAKKSKKKSGADPDQALIEAIQKRVRVPVATTLSCCTR